MPSLIKRGRRHGANFTEFGGKGLQLSSAVFSDLAAKHRRMPRFMPPASRARTTELYAAGHPPSARSPWALRTQFSPRTLPTAAAASARDHEQRPKHLSLLAPCSPTRQASTPSSPQLAPWWADRLSGSLARQSLPWIRSTGGSRPKSWPYLPPPVRRLLSTFMDGPSTLPPSPHHHPQTHSYTHTQMRRLFKLERTHIQVSTYVTPY